MKLPCPKCGNKLVYVKGKLICECGFSAKAKEVTYKIPVKGLGLAVPHKEC